MQILIVNARPLFCLVLLRNRSIEQTWLTDNDLIRFALPSGDEILE